MKRFDKISLIKEAKELGAITYRLFYTTNNSKRSVFSYHFFDQNDEEISYLSEDMYPLVGLTKLETPRVWGDNFKQGENYSAPMQIGMTDCNHELGEGEVWLGNTNVEKGVKIPEHLRGLKTVRLGERAYDINGHMLSANYMRPLIISKSEEKAYDKAMMDRVRAVGRVVTRIG